MRRRTFVTLLGGTAAAWPLLARAQQESRAWRIGLLDASSPEAGRLRLWDAFRQRMRELGYVEGDNVAFEPRWAEGSADRLRAAAAELVNLKVNVIATAGGAAVQAAKRATNTIPIVMATAPNPVSLGVVASLNRPGGNVTGVVTMSSDLAAKRMGLLREAVPRASRFAMIWDAGSEGARIVVHDTQSAAQAVGISLLLLSARGAEDLDGAFASMVRDQAAALVVSPSPSFFVERRRLADLAVKNRLAMVGNVREYAEAGGLMTYGPDYTENFRRAANYVDKIIKGDKPADLPIQQPTKFELVINLKTAKALGLTIPPSILAQADEVIE
jgi:putative ABC transport system substrate-binding protein